jgi:hypothetical protein
MKAKSSDREQRLAAALRENLKRRKSRDREQSREEPPKLPERPNKAQKSD